MGNTILIHIHKIAVLILYLSTFSVIKVPCVPHPLVLECLLGLPVAQLCLHLPDKLWLWRFVVTKLIFGHFNGIGGWVYNISRKCWEYTTACMTGVIILSKYRQMLTYHRWALIIFSSHQVQVTCKLNHISQFSSLGLLAGPPVKIDLLQNLLLSWRAFNIDKNNDLTFT